MKKILGLITAVFFVAISFAQSGVSFKDASTDYNKSTATSFHFAFNDKYTAEDIKSSAEYYESYFSVTTTPNSANGTDVTIKLVNDNEMARRVITRLFVSLEVDSINVNGKELEQQTFMDTYITK
ncbi:hypothetical protein [Crocinitomix catalasitica]|uniref:hypothetical protein n=1 Tax=Crocinitomix catalasitica TaxID=184607 RepID=UPI000482C2DD|nr:hypothetical protein [Crocinitomix catalasitica]